MSKLGDGVRIDLGEVRVGDLLALSRAILAELRRRGVIRSGNAPAGDYAELLVQRATTGELAPNSQKSWDVVTGDGERLQVKARVVTDPRVRGERQLSVFRSWDFDGAVIVLFDDEFRVWRAARLPVETLQAAARASFSTSAATACSLRMNCWTPATTGRGAFAPSSSDTGS
ncbi:MAG: hypothetical protein H0U03_10800 [Actinobacteria bacterium]|nr:hypothetical protein [Actinomycetota bacterium]